MIYIYGFLFTIALSSCITINMHNTIHINEPRSLVQSNSNTPFSLPRYNLKNNTLDLHLSSVKNNWMLNLHLDPSSNNDTIVLSGIKKAINDSSYSNTRFFIPPGVIYNSTISYRDQYILIDIHVPDQAGKDIKDDNLTISTNEIDSSRNGFESKSYSGLVKDKKGNEYYFSATTDPLPILLIVVIGCVVIYEKGKCSDLEKKCIEKNQRPLINHHFWSSCELIKCY